MSPSGLIPNTSSSHSCDLPRFTHPTPHTKPPQFLTTGAGREGKGEDKGVGKRKTVCESVDVCACVCVHRVSCMTNVCDFRSLLSSTSQDSAETRDRGAQSDPYIASSFRRWRHPARHNSRCQALPAPTQHTKGPGENIRGSRRYSWTRKSSSTSSP